MNHRRYFLLFSRKARKDKLRQEGRGMFSAQLFTSSPLLNLCWSSNNDFQSPSPTGSKPTRNTQKQVLPGTKGWLYARQQEVCWHDDACLRFININASPLLTLVHLSFLIGHMTEWLTGNHLWFAFSVCSNPPEKLSHALYWDFLWWSNTFIYLSWVIL